MLVNLHAYIFFCLPSLRYLWLPIQQVSLLLHACLLVSLLVLSLLRVYLVCYANTFSYIATYNNIIVKSQVASYSVYLAIDKQDLRIPISSATMVTYSLFCLPSVLYTFLVYLLIQSYCVAYNLHCLSSQPACSLMELAYSMSALRAYPVCYV